MNNEPFLSQPYFIIDFDLLSGDKWQILLNRSCEVGKGAMQILPIPDPILRAFSTRLRGSFFVYGR